jgi:hypothetical protein
MYNLLSDKLDRFEREVRKVRNTVVAKIMFVIYSLGRFAFSRFKPYIHTENLRKFRELLVSMD